MTRATPAEALAMLQGRKAHGNRHRHIPGQMNRVEASYDAFLQSRWLKREITWYKFEPFSLKLTRDLHYRPDFAWIEAEDGLLVIADTKGRTKNKTTGLSAPYIEDDALVKIKAAAAIFPFKFIITWPLAGGIAWGVREIGA